ncbi:hypothetical protein EBU94_04915 [bacterium]|nr:hypothetical protein [bacterium]
MTDDFIKKLMISKQIMDKHNEIPRSGSQGSLNENIRIPNDVEVYNPEPIPAKYNIPQEYMGQQKSIPTSPPVVTEDKIKNSKLPDAIKDLMMKHPIRQPESYSPTISNDVIEKAARLMGENKTITQSSNTPTSKTPQTSNGDLKRIVKETLEELLVEHGIISESQTKTDEIFQFKVGKHLFEGKITKIKKLR